MFIYISLSLGLFQARRSSCVVSVSLFYVAVIAVHEALACLMFGVIAAHLVWLCDKLSKNVSYRANFCYMVRRKQTKASYASLGHAPFAACWGHAAWQGRKEEK